MTLLSTTEPLHLAHDAALVDLDGVAYRGPLPVPHAGAGLAAARDAGMRLVFVTNNASREPESVAAQLTGLDIPTEPDEVLTAAQAAARLLRDHVAVGSRVLVVGGPGLLTAVRNAGFQIVTSADDHPSAVVQGFSPDLGWTHLAEAAYAIQNGAVHIVSNLDATLPNERGLAPGNGSLVRVVTAATGTEPVSAGKPEPTMFHLAAARVDARHPLVIGDRLDTDLAGARAAHYPGLHVLTGVSTARDAVLAPTGHRPSYIGLDLRCLSQVHAAPRQDGDRWVCGTATATVTDGVLRVEDGPGGDPVDTLRAACAAAWDAVDAGRPLETGSVPDLVGDR
ncbi:HAD-IIA family hydrolase [Cellulomonas bogoriensis]|uniref:HAD family hydrolase n=1 Tax=Cellulomonas bogoriensis 69B4 = DSM 16987 TaxID=1386082 RepID=A0A0A0BN28_9CELL|nr:HAD-IIA family hydrolase [Cellulomonas bogoriensis]KGM09361.1 HAD family hydrolase [Cellulomonas bogoriensis 69B4 = DSM 16987]